MVRENEGSPRSCVALTLPESPLLTRRYLARAAVFVLAPCVAAALPTSAQEPPDSLPPDSAVALPGITVPIGRLRVGAVPLAEAPFPVQVVSLTGAPSAGLSDALSGLPGVTLASQTGSRFQPDIRLRGFAVSPIVGVPQSVSVFVDGVRVNEADASQVHLSLIPAGAVERIELIRGPGGALGKNVLAGALNIVTRRGTGDGGIEIDVEGGSYGSVGGTLRAGGTRGAYDGLLVGSYRKSDGWRPLGYSDELSLFGKVGWRGEHTDAWLSYTFEADSLEGPGPLPESWLGGGPLPTDILFPPKDRRRLQYTGGSGDAFVPRMHFLNGRVERRLTSAWSLLVTSFGRFVDFRQSNDNITEPDALGLTDIGSLGSTAQITYQGTGRLLVTLGAEGVRNDVEIDIRRLPNRTFPDLLPATTERIQTDETNLATFGEVWWGFRPGLALHASLRFDYVDLPVRDLLDPSDSGDNSFSELSGGIGISGDLGSGWSAFGGYGRGFRSPVILELTCADPEDPCQLPFELGPDPPLRPVTSNSWQGGLRLNKEGLSAEAVGYWSEVHDDIFNVVDLETPTRGFFTNLEKTRRLGVELTAAATGLVDVRGLSVSASLGWTRATFQSNAVLAAPFLEDDDEGEAGGTTEELAPPEVEPGDRFPMVPELALAATLRYQVGGTVLKLQGHWISDQFLVGDEGNDSGFEKLSSYTGVDIRMEHRVAPFTVYAEIANLLDRNYSAFGIISGNVRGPQEAVERFLTPALPRRLTVGVRVAGRTPAAG